MKELDHTVRYFNSWVEDLTKEERKEEIQKLERYRSKRLSSINEEENSDELRSSYEDNHSRTSRNFTSGVSYSA